MDTTTTITRQNSCWCGTIRTLIGQHICTDRLPNPPKVDHVIVVVTDIDHTSTATGPRCWLVLDGWHRWALPVTEDRVEIVTTDEPTTLGQRIREPLVHHGALTLSDAADLVRQYEAAYQMAGLAIPRLPGGSTKARRAFTPRAPKTPITARSYYTQGRIRRVPETGRWAADQGFAGTTRPLGEYDTPDEAEQRIIAATSGAWDALEAWLLDHVGGDWHLVRETGVDIEILDRMTSEQAAALAGVEPSTWRAYVARGQAPAASGTGAAGRDYWDRVDVLAWLDIRPGQGKRG